MLYVQTRRIDRNGRIILTRELQEFLGAGPGQALEFTPTPEGILIRRAAGKPSESGASPPKNGQK